MLENILIIGRPNVGKSSLFNRLIGRKEAIVHNRRGVTRDLKTQQFSYRGQEYTLTDSAGLEEALNRKAVHAPEDIYHLDLLAEAVEGSSLVLMMLDICKGVTNQDRDIAEWLRGFDKTCLVLLNKAEGYTEERLALPLAEAYGLGLGEVMPISATHNQGKETLLQWVAAHIFSTPDTLPIPDIEDAEEVPIKPRKLAILGRPNVGKSTLTNALLGYARQITGNTAGLTRDAIEINWYTNVHAPAPWSLIDTAGLKSHGQYRDSLDRATAEATWNAIKEASVVALVIEATSPLTRGDLSIAKDCAALGRPMILVVNKTDLCSNPQEMAKELSYTLAEDLAQVRDVPFVCISALKKKGIRQIAELAEAQAEKAATRIGTGALNRWLENMLIAHPLPLINGRRLRIKYITQTDISPPEFMLFGSQKVPIPETYLRYLRNGLVDQFGLSGIPLLLKTRTSKNPFDTPKKEDTTETRQKHIAKRNLLPKKQQRRPAITKKGKKVLSLKGRAKKF